MAMSFPSLRQQVEAVWMPLLLRPFADSPERLVIGVAAISKAGFHLEQANSLRRLECLLGQQAAEVIAVAKLGLKSFENQIAEHGVEIASTFRSPVSGISLGPSSDAAGLSLEEISTFWLGATSSLQDTRRQVAFELDRAPLAAGDLAERRVLPAAEIVRNVLVKQPALLANFRPHFIKAQRLAAHKNDVDYKSESLVVNIDFMAHNFRAQTVNRIIKRMWDLEIDRGSNDNAPEDSHEMLVEIPERDEMTRVEADRLSETVDQLTWQADQRSLRFRPLASASAISDRILEAEAA